MTYVINVLNGTTQIDVDFADEEVTLTGTTHIKGGEDDAERYVKVFEKDLRNVYSEMFPIPEPEPAEEGEFE